MPVGCRSVIRPRRGRNPGDMTSSAGQVPTWEEVARDHGRFLYTVAYRLTGNHEDAQDLVQEVLLRVQRGLATLRARVRSRAG